MDTLIIIAIIISLVIVLTRTASSKGDDKEIPDIDPYTEVPDRKDKKRKDDKKPPEGNGTK